MHRELHAIYLPDQYIYISIYKYNIYIYSDTFTLKTMARDPLEFGSLFAYRVV